LRKSVVFLTPQDIETIEWQPVPGMPGMWERILANDDETGSATRLFKAEPGFESDEVRVHDFWEESYLLEGSFETNGVVYGAGTFACNPPGYRHGPYSSKTGWLELVFGYLPTGEQTRAK
jgi:hypothetical protein